MADSGGPSSGVRAVAERSFRGLAVLVLCGVAGQIYAAGLIWYGRPSGHRALGWLVMAAALANVPLAALGRAGRARVSLATAVAGLLLLQPVFVFGLARVSPWLGALHALNAAVVLVLSWELTRRAIGVRR